MNEQPFYHKVRHELAAMERALFIRSALGMVAGGLIALAVALVAYLIL